MSSFIDPKPTDEEMKRFASFIGKIWIQATDGVPQTLFHYTTGQSFIQIVSNNEIWTTQAACLNDEKEVLYAAELITESLSEVLISGQIEKEDAQVLDCMLHSIRSNSRIEVATTFVVSFSAKDDDLSQWRAYGGSDGGYSIGFRPTGLALEAQRHQGLLAKVIYDPIRQREIAKSVIESTRTFYRQGLQQRDESVHTEWRQKFVSKWLDFLGALSPLVKHPSFRDEDEWRIVLGLVPERIKDIKITAGKTMLRRHLSLFGRSEGSALLPISQVRVGPSIHKHVSAVAVGDLLKIHGHGQNPSVVLSSIPYRAM